MAIFVIWMYQYNRYVRKCGDGDDKMQQAGRGSKGDGGNAKRGKGDDPPDDDDDDDDVNDLTQQMQDLRTPSQRQNDIRRRLATQCIHIGWHPCNPGEPPTNPGSTHVYRRCQSLMGVATKPWCDKHHKKPHDDPAKDPSFKRHWDKDDKGDKKGKKGGPSGGGGGRKPRGHGWPAWITGFLGAGEVTNDGGL